jgi:DNA mismatch repair protein MutH
MYSLHARASTCPPDGGPRHVAERVTMATPADEEELLESAAALAGRTLGELAERHGIVVPADLKRAKGWVGELLETALGATAGSRPVPDFEDLGIELKTVPLNSRHQPQESTFVCTAPLANTIGLRWTHSTVKAKLDKVLWVPVEGVRNVRVAHRRIGRALLWSPSLEDAEILREDWEEHIERIALGYLDELDARLGTYLQVRPKAINRHDRTNAMSRVGAPTSALPRGFYLRTCFTRKILCENRP